MDEDANECTRAVRDGNLVWLRRAHASGTDLVEETYVEAIRNATDGTSCILEYLVDHNCPWDRSVYGSPTEYAAAIGNLLALTWLSSHVEGWSVPVISIAARCGHVHVLNWLFRQPQPAEWLGNVWRLTVFITAVECDRLEVIKWWRKVGFDWTDTSCQLITFHGRLNILKWAFAHGCPLTVTAVNNAAMDGDMDTLEWLQANRCPWDEGTCATAAAAGRLDVLKFLRKSGCPWDKRVAQAAVQHDYVDIFLWTTKHGAPLKNERVKPTEAKRDELNALRRAAVMSLHLAGKANRLELPSDVLMVICDRAGIYCSC